MNKVILLLIVRCLVVIKIGIVCHAERLSPKLGFEEESNKEVDQNNESSKVSDDVEVQHTIVVTTKLRNNNPIPNQGGFRKNPTTFVNSGSTSNLSPPYWRRSYDDQAKSEVNDSGEVPVIKGYKGIENTERRPSSRSDVPDVYPDADSVVIVANVDRDKVGYGIHREDLSSGNQWRPSTFFNNINNYDLTPEYFSYDIPRTKGLNLINTARESITGSGSFFTPREAEEPWKTNTNLNTDCCKCRRGLRKQLVSWNQPRGDISTKASVDGKIVKPFN